MIHAPAPKVLSVLRTAYSFDGGDFVNVYSAALAAALDGAKGWLLEWVRITDAGVWADAAVRTAGRLVVDASNLVLFAKTATANQIVIRYIAGGTTKQVLDTSLAATTNWFLLGLTWDKAADEMKAYINGAQVGVTQTGLGTWAGSLNATNCALGADNTAGANGHKGLLAHAAVGAGSALTSAQVLAVYNATVGGMRETIMSYAPAAYWMLAENSGTVAASATGASYDGVLGTGAAVPTLGLPGVDTATLEALFTRPESQILHAAYESSVVSA